MIVHGFPSMTPALRFEWAWQQPQGSRRIKKIESIQKRRRGETHFNYHFRILTELINVGPWNRLALKVRWFENEYVTDFPVSKNLKSLFQLSNFRFNTPFPGRKIPHPNGNMFWCNSCYKAKNFFTAATSQHPRQDTRSH